jgi:hypothetical protein
MRRLSLPLLVASLLTALLIAGCGSDEPEAVDGDGYTFEAPDGWKDVTGDSEEIADLIGGAGGDAAAAAAGAYDVAVVSDETSNDFRTNFNVGLQEDLPPDYDSLRLAEQNIAVFRNPDQVEGLLPEGIEVDFVGEEPRRITLGGETAYEVQYGLTTSEAELEAVQVFAVHDDTAYVGTYTADAEAFDPDSEDLRHILESWEWD